MDQKPAQTPVRIGTSISRLSSSFRTLIETRKRVINLELKSVFKDMRLASSIGTITLPLLTAAFVTMSYIGVIAFSQEQDLNTLASFGEFVAGASWVAAILLGLSFVVIGFVGYKLRKIEIRLKGMAKELSLDLEAFTRSRKNG